MTNHIQLSEDEARTLTRKAMATANELASLLKQLHDGQAHKALGFKTWTAYIERNFDVSLRTIQRYIRQERVREALVGHDSVSRFTNGALEALADPDIDHMRQVAAIAAKSVTGDIGVDVVKSVQAAITETVNTGAVDIDGEQYTVGDALAAGVRGALQEDVLSKREYIVANVEASVHEQFTNAVLLYVYLPDGVFLYSDDDLRISIWREQ
jgi:hypothetical protein